MKYVPFFLLIVIAFLSGYYMGNEQYLKTGEESTGSFAGQEKIKQPSKNKTVVTKPRKKSAERLRQATGENNKVLQTQTQTQTQTQIITKDNDKKNAKEKFIDSLREDGIPEEEIEILAEGFTFPSSSEENPLTPEQLTLKSIITADMRNDGLPEEEIEMMAEELAKTGSLDTYNQPAYTAEEMRDKFIADLREDGIPEEEIEIMAAAFFVPDEPDTYDSAAHNDDIEESVQDDDLLEEEIDELDTYDSAAYNDDIEESIQDNDLPEEEIMGEDSI
ncbi:MAG: hypothetical protein D3917_01705 [Candidatus Electrothrix sp. AX5]|nr:hypothetical protein [Candidatus Electrothrix sp. AX5]